MVKVGDEIKMYFYAFGVTSESNNKILRYDDETVTIDDGDNGRTFSRKTGRCLNDNTFGGAMRTINPC